MRRICALLSAAVAVAGFAGCGSSGSRALASSSRPANLPASYLHACEHDSSAAVCGCVRAHVNAMVSPATFTAGEALLDRGGTIPYWWLDAVHACRVK